MTKLTITARTVHSAKDRKYPTSRSTGNARLDRMDHNWAVREYYKAREAKPRVYISIEDESLLENLGNRTSRPYQDWKPLVEQELADMDILYTRVRWSQKAGCTMCPCSPGFIVDDAHYADGRRVTGLDIWLTLAGDTPKTDNPELAADRMAQVAADPTIPTEALVNTVLTPARTYTFADFDGAGL